MDLIKINEIISKISFKNSVLDFKWRFRVQETVIGIHKAWLIWVEFERPDTDTGEIGIGSGRKEIIWHYNEESSVVKTCWLLIELVVRHELMEGFNYNGKRIFNPHTTVADLCSIQH